MNLNINEEKVLNLLRQDPFMSQKELAEKVHVSRPAVANIISSLQQKGYILGKPYLLRQDTYVTCCGGANVDVGLKVTGDLIKGTSNPVHARKSFGGVVRNVAENLARLGLNVSLMSLIGDDAYGQELISFNSELMETFASDILPHESTGTYYSIIDQDGDMKYGFADMQINRLMDRSWVLKHKKHLLMSAYIIADMNVSKDGLEALLEIKEEMKIPLAIIGVSGPKMSHLPENINGLDLLICNIDESMTYFKQSKRDPKVLVNSWLDKGVNAVIITDGTNGSYIGYNQKVHHQKAYMVEKTLVKDVTGAGDAFSSAVLYGIIKGEKLETAAKLGAINSSLTVQVPFAVNPNISIKKIEKELNNYDN
ncbi:MAG: carbohydrate kinase [Candidatus Izemoplasmataceae bacterium]